MGSVLFFPVPLSPVVHVVDGGRVSIERMFGYAVFDFVAVEYIVAVYVVFVRFGGSSDGFPYSLPDASRWFWNVIQFLGFLSSFVDGVVPAEARSYA